MSNPPQAWATTATGAEIEARNRRMMENQGLVHKVARVFRGNGVAYEDLVQFGQFGLMRAAEKFDEGRGIRFSTYATYWIRNTIFKGIGNTARPVRIPLHAKKELARYRATKKSLGEELGRPPERGEVIDEMVPECLPRKRLRIHAAVAAEAAQQEGCPIEDYAAVVAADSPSSLTSAIRAEHREQVGRAMEILDRRQREVLTWRYGLDGSLPLDIKATAAMLGSHWRAVTKLEGQAIERLKELLNR